MLAVYQWYHGYMRAASLCCFFTLIFAAWVLSYFFVDFFFRERRRKKEIIFETMTCRVSKMDLYKKDTYAAYAVTDTEICTEPIMVDSITFQKWHKDNSCPFLLVRYNTKKDPQAKFFQLFLHMRLLNFLRTISSLFSVSFFPLPSRRESGILYILNQNGGCLYVRKRHFIYHHPCL